MIVRRWRQQCSIDEMDVDGDGFVECELDPSTYLVLATEEDDFGQIHDVISVYTGADTTVTLSRWWRSTMIMMSQPILVR